MATSFLQSLERKALHSIHAGRGRLRDERLPAPCQREPIDDQARRAVGLGKAETIAIGRKAAGFSQMARALQATQPKPAVCRRLGRLARKHAKANQRIGVAIAKRQKSTGVVPEFDQRARLDRFWTMREVV